MKTSLNQIRDTQFQAIHQLLTIKEMIYLKDYKILPYFEVRYKSWVPIKNFKTKRSLITNSECLINVEL
jgi:hypothetical protein